MEKYLIVGLGNVGDEYAGTRHNAGFIVLDAFAKASNAVFEDKRYGFVAHTSVKGRQVTLLKPSTYMNLSGNAVRYWLNKENIDPEKMLIIVDDVALPLGAFRLRKSGSAGGHNGLRNIESVLCSQLYSRLRIGIGNDFPTGMQIQFVLGHFSDEDMKELNPVVETSGEIIKSFVLSGIDFTMNQYNNKGKK
ncbi:MAG: aminoacyl-tRNA hydrolase [Bacteroidaceae bacterium]|nr:aminoacyl-tRNA hydrolase [Bacteroidaceae bacterium]